MMIQSKHLKFATLIAIVVLGLGVALKFAF